jgi:hypothetical protein
MLGQKNRRRNGTFLGDKEVVAPNQDANVVGGHVKEIEKIALLAKEPIGHKSPMSEEDGSRNPETEYDPEN